MPAVRTTTSLTTALLTGTLLLVGCAQGSDVTSGGSVSPNAAGSSAPGAAGTPTASSTATPGASTPAGGDSATKPGASTPAGGNSTSTGSAAADLTIVVDDGAGTTTTWHLTCEPAGGNHPDPARACAVLAQHAATALPPVPPGRMCTQIFGGAHTAHITGTWRGTKVDARLSRVNGCEIARWQALIGLLPYGDS